MDPIRDALRALAFAGALLVSGVATPGPAGAQDVDFDLEVELLPLVQLPVAVARVEAAGVPLADLRTLVPTLFEAGVPPSGILETVRYLPAAERRDVAFGVDDDEFRRSVEGEAARGSRGMGSYVQALHARGLRGRDLADAIHRELNRRGIPAGGAAGAGRGGRTAERGPGVLERGFLFDVDDDPVRPGRGVAPGRNSGAAGRQGPPQGRGPQGQGRQGPPADAGPPQGRQGPPADAGPPPGRQGPPSDAGPPRDRGGPPDDRGGPPEGRGGPPDDQGGTS